MKKMPSAEEEAISQVKADVQIFISHIL